MRIIGLAAGARCERAIFFFLSHEILFHAFRNTCIIFLKMSSAKWKVSQQISHRSITYFSVDESFAETVNL